MQSRRKFLSNAGGGFGAVALSALMGENLIAGSSIDTAASAKIPHHFGKAKSVIFLFMEGGPSHLDLFDRKPLLRKLAGQKLPDSFETPVTAAGEVNSPLLPDQRKWAQHGESGLWISDWLPNHSRIADELCVIRSCVTDGINHAGGVCQMNTGAVFGGDLRSDPGCPMGWVRQAATFLTLSSSKTATQWWSMEFVHGVRGLFLPLIKASFSNRRIHPSQISTTPLGFPPPFSNRSSPFSAT